MNEASWPGEWLRGVLPLCVLSVISEGATYGYAITQHLQDAGLGRVKGGTLYPILNRLERDGLVCSSWEAGSGGPGRKTLRITADGLSHLTARRQAWQTFTERAAAVVRTNAGDHT